MIDPANKTGTKSEDRLTAHLDYMQTIADKLGTEAGVTAVIDDNVILVRDSFGDLVLPSVMFYVTGSCHDDYVQVENAIEQAVLILEAERKARADAPPAPAAYTLTAMFTMEDTSGDNIFDWEPAAAVVICTGGKSSVMDVEFPSEEALSTHEYTEEYDEMCAASIRSALLKVGVAADAGRWLSAEYLCTAETPVSPCWDCNGHDRVVTWEFSVKVPRPVVSVSLDSDDDFS